MRFFLSGDSDFSVQASGHKARGMEQRAGGKGIKVQDLK
jgi:hypothetical protein